MTKRVFLVRLSDDVRFNYDRRVTAFNEKEALDIANGIWSNVVGVELDKYHYVPYTLAEMMNDSTMGNRLKQRIQHLVNVGALRLSARNDGGTFVAYAGKQPLTRKAVLLVNIVGVCYIAIEKGDTGNDYLAKVADICTKYSYAFKGV